VVIQKGKEDIIEGIFKKWDLHCKKIGEVTDSKRLEFYQHGKLIADVPAHDLVLGGGAPQYHREYKEPAYYQEFKKFDPASVEDIKDEAEFKAVATHLLSHPNIASRNWVYEQYDSMVGTANASTNRPSDAAVVRLRTLEKGDLNKGIVITVDCNGRYVNADPELGTQIAVAEAARNIVCSGGEPLAITNNLNFGNPYNPEVYWQFVGAVKGMTTACLKFNTPVTGGNVSFYNQSSDDGPVFPTPTIGMLGLIEDLNNKTTLAFQNEGDSIYLIGKQTEDIASSEYLYSYKGIKASPAPYFNLEEEHAMQKALATLIKDKALISAHDLSDGGLYIALAEAAIAGNLGFTVNAEAQRKDAFWFGEAQGRVIVTVANEQAFESAASGLNLPVLKLGKVTASDFLVNGNTVHSSSEAEVLYKTSLKKMIEA
jgi:phosphoribosylformylglycinamidine synthase II